MTPALAEAPLSVGQRTQIQGQVVEIDPLHGTWFLVYMLISGPREWQGQQAFIEWDAGETADEAYRKPHTKMGSVVDLIDRYLQERGKEVVFTGVPLEIGKKGIRFRGEVWGGAR